MPTRLSSEFLRVWVPLSDGMVHLPHTNIDGLLLNPSNERQWQEPETGAQRASCQFLLLTALVNTTGRISAAVSSFFWHRTISELIQRSGQCQQQNGMYNICQQR